MNEGQSDDTTDTQRQIDDLRSRLDAAEARADASEARADKAELRADDSAHRADIADVRTDASDVRSVDDRLRLTTIEGRLDLREEMIAELQGEGLISSTHAEHLEVALQTARTIGAAVGIVMSVCRVSEVAAFQVLRKASMDSNRRLRLVAEEVVLTGDVTGLLGSWQGAPAFPPQMRGHRRAGISAAVSRMNESAVHKSFRSADGTGVTAVAHREGCRSESRHGH